MKKKLVADIEHHLNWGSGNDWTNKDFKELSEQILKVTGKQLSVTTLKRIWGRAETVANTSISTLDILSEFLGYESWRNYQQKMERVGWPKTKGTLLKFGFGGLAVILLLIFLLKEKNTNEKQPQKTAQFSEEAILFSFEKVSIGYPNTVIFRYDVGDASYDSLSIQQSWDTTKRIPLNAPNGLVTSTYYQPGYFLAKLVANGMIIKERNLYIPTKGWQAMVLGESDRKTYLKPEHIVHGQSLKFVPEVMDEMQNLEESYLYAANLSPEPFIDGANFEVSSKFRMERSKDKSICQTIRMTITGTREVISLQFSIPGCVGDLLFFVDKEMISGKNHDFSAFGKDSGQWINCNVEVKEKELKVFLDGEEAFSKTLKVDLGKIGGVQWYFEGLGEIDKLLLKDDLNTLDLTSD